MSTAARCTDFLVQIECLVNQAFLPSVPLEHLVSHPPFRSLRNHNTPNGPSMQFPVPHALSHRENSRELMGVLGSLGGLNVVGHEQMWPGPICIL